MEKYKLTGGENIFVLRVEHNVTLLIFSVALADKFYNDMEEFPTKLTKKVAEEILRRSLFFYGTRGQFEDGYFESFFEESERYGKILDASYLWVKERYEWLRNT